MQRHQRRILARIADEIDTFREGRQSMQELLNNAWALFEAAEVREPAERDRFMFLYYAVSTADDARQPWMPAVCGSDQHVNVALVGFEAWARSIRDQHRADDEDTE